MKISAIGWTDYSGGDLNFVTGCTPVSPGCANCYARVIYSHYKRDFSIVRTHSEKLHRLQNARFPRHSPKRGAPHKPMAFVCDTGDLFHEEVPDEFIYHALTIMEARDHVIWQILTKRPRRMLEMVCHWTQSVSRLITARPRLDFLSPNIWLGVTAENQQTADERIPLLLSIPASVRFVSAEPMLDWIYDIDQYVRPENHIEWVICGAESGRARRKFDPTWARELYWQCRDWGVPFFFKQGSGLYPGMNDRLPNYGRVQEWPE